MNSYVQNASKDINLLLIILCVFKKIIAPQEIVNFAQTDHAKLVE